MLAFIDASVANLRFETRSEFVQYCCSKFLASSEIFFLDPLDYIELREPLQEGFFLDIDDNTYQTIKAHAEEFGIKPSLALRSILLQTMIGGPHDA